MTNPIALGLGIAILIGFGLDASFNDSRVLIYLFRQITNLVDFLTFWF